MDPAIKKVALLLAAALLVVIGLIVLTSGTDAKKAEVATTQNEQTVAVEDVQTENKTAPTAQEPTDEAQASQEDVTNQAQSEEDAQEEMYEGALAGLSEEEIAKMALAEEESAARTDTTTGAEDAVD